MSTSGSTFAKRDPALGEVIGREFDLYLISRHDADEVFSHLASDMRVDNVATCDLDAKPRVGEGLSNDPFYLESLFFFRHGFPCCRRGLTASNKRNGALIVAPARETVQPRPRSGIIADGLRGRTRGLPAKIGVEEAVEITVEHALEITDIMACPLIFDPLIWVEKVVADL